MNGNGVVVVLSGGGGRAMAHLGALEVLERARVPISRIVGVSAGAVAGALFGRYGSAREAQTRLAQVLSGPKAGPTCDRIARFRSDRNGFRGRIVRWFGYWRLMRRAGIVPSRHLMRAMEGLVGTATFEDLRFPLTVVTTDLMHGRELVSGSGPLVPVLAGTCALPGVFEPVPVNGHLLVDSGDLNPLPVNVAARYRPAFTIASDVSRGKLPPKMGLNGIEALARARDAGALVLRSVHQRMADFVIRPRVLRREWVDFSNPEQAYQAGRAAASRKLDRLLAGLQWKEIVPC